MRWIYMGRSHLPHALILRLIVLITCTTLVSCCVVLQVVGHGFASNINALFSALPAYYGFNGSIFLYNYHFVYKCTDEGGLHEFFATEPDFLAPWTPAVDELGCEFVEWPDLRKLAGDFLNYGDAHYDPLIVKKFWRLRPSLQAEVDAALAELQSYAKPTVAFHVRGGDKPKEDAAVGRTTTRPTDLVNAFMRNFINVTGGTCVLVGDDPRLLAEVAHLATKHVRCKVAPRTLPKEPDGHHQPAFNRLPLQERCRATKDLIRDIELMAHADYFVGSTTSGLKMLVDTLRHTLYEKSLASAAEVGDYDVGHRLRVHWGTANDAAVDAQSNKLRLLMSRQRREQ